MNPISDAELMERYARGDASAFDALFDRYDRRIFAFFVGRTRCVERAADLHQELFLRLHRFRDRFDPARPFAPWVFALARNVWHDDLRRRHDLVDGGNAAIEVEATDASFESRVVARDEARRLIDCLAPDDRALVFDTAVAGFTYAELARPGIRSMDALKQAGSRALRRLRRRSAEERE
jgi:RNA polymerase sigma-70 factor (ECF subfamily)